MLLHCVTAKTLRQKSDTPIYSVISRKSQCSCSIEPTNVMYKIFRNLKFRGRPGPLHPSLSNRKEIESLCEEKRERQSRLLPRLQFPPLVQAPGTGFYTWVEWGTTYERTVLRARPNEHSKRTGPPSSADKFPCLMEKPVGSSEF